jgi:zinc transporter ZupT
MPPAPPPTGREVDVRGPRAAAWVTSAVLAVALLTGGGWLVAAQAAVFAVGAFAGLRYAPYGVLFRVLVAPRLGPVREREPEAPARFAQLVGLVFAVVGAAGYLSGAPLVGAFATGLALVAALLNAATGFCLGCELYLTVRRARPARTA